MNIIIYLNVIFKSTTGKTSEFLVGPISDKGYDLTQILKKSKDKLLLSIKLFNILSYLLLHT